MADWLEFEGQIDSIVMGRARYTLVRLPKAISEPLTAAGVKRVEVEVNDHPTNLALSRNPHVPDVFLWVGKSILAQTGLQPGMEVAVRLRPAPTDTVDLPDDVARALHANGLADRFAALSPGQQRARVYKIACACKEQTRATRLNDLIAALRGLHEGPHP